MIPRPAAGSRGKIACQFCGGQYSAGSRLHPVPELLLAVARVLHNKPPPAPNEQQALDEDEAPGPAAEEPAAPAEEPVAPAADEPVVRGGDESDDALAAEEELTNENETAMEDKE